MKETWIPSRHRSPRAVRERGIVLPLVIFALALMSVLVVIGVTSAGDDRTGSFSLQEGTRSFYAAEAGLNNVIANWNANRYDTLVTAAGSSSNLGWQTLFSPASAA